MIFKVGATFTAYFHKGQVLGDKSVNANFCGKFDGFFALFELFVKDNSVYRLHLAGDRALRLLLAVHL